MTLAAPPLLHLAGVRCLFLLEFVVENKNKHLRQQETRGHLRRHWWRKGHQMDDKPRFVQISPETYAHLTDSEEQVKVLDEKVKTLNEELFASQSEITTKDALVKQHAKVAEEAVLGWEKAEAVASAQKVQLETVTLSKLAAEERAAHLDGALKECPFSSESGGRRNGSTSAVSPLRPNHGRREESQVCLLFG